jgi:predicted oxidoreductase
MLLLTVMLMNVRRCMQFFRFRGLPACCLAFVVLFAPTGCDKSPPPAESPAADVVIIGAGVAGLSAAFEVARAGRSVLVVDMLSVFGGHSLLSTGGLSIVDTPLQRKRGIADSPDLAFADFIAWGEDSNEEWVRYYVDHSSEEIYDWLTDLGVEFTVAVKPPGNSVPRYHFIRGQGFGLMMPIYRAVLEEPGVQFRLSTRADELIHKNGRIVGVKATDLRSGEAIEFFAGAVLIATGGMQSDLDAVRANWREDLPEPEQLLAGSGWNSRGSGLDLARDVGAKIEHLDHQWNFVTGIPDPRYPRQLRGLSVLQVPPGREIWVNMHGRRFVNECTSSRDSLPAVLDQPADSHWVVFDSRGKKLFRVSGSGWTQERTERLIFANPGLVKTAPTLVDLAAQMKIDADQLMRSVSNYNDLVEKAVNGIEPEAGEITLCNLATAVGEPPFYAVQRFVLSRKTMGGIRIDASARVVDVDGTVIPGLYAAGEASGFAGINGRAALEGTHLGPSIVTGRVAGRQMAAELANQPVLQVPMQSTEPTFPPMPVTDPSDAVCTECHDLPVLVRKARPGYRHFQWSHAMVLEEQMTCITCHEGFFPYAPVNHHLDISRATEICARCHGS